MSNNLGHSVLLTVFVELGSVGEGVNDNMSDQSIWHKLKMATGESLFRPKMSV